MALKEEAGWNQTRQDWIKLLEAAPQGCFGMEIDGALVATTTAVSYGTELAWVGMVLTASRYRGRGFAGALLEHAVDYLAREKVNWIKLDATVMGRPIYQRFGFEDECAIERWLRTGAPARNFPEENRESQFGRARGRPGSEAAYFGPCIADSPEAARDLLQWFLELHPGEAVFWDILPANSRAVDLARANGFAPVRRLTRMARLGRPGVPARPTDTVRTYAIAGFEWG